MRKVPNLLIALLLTAMAASGAPEAAESADLCAAPIAHQERRQGIPEGLLHAISLVEAGRWDAGRQASIAWPWTVTAEGRGRFLPSKRAAVDEVARLQALGVRNIDVGCMQVNLQHHPEAFANLDKAFDPGANVAYAARFLTDLHAAAGAWTTAASHYHSRTPHLAASYQRRLAKLWRTGTTAAAPGVGAARAAAVQAEYQRQTEAERDDVRRAAAAYRAAVLAEYTSRRAAAVSLR